MPWCECHRSEWCECPPPQADARYMTGLLRHGGRRGGIVLVQILRFRSVRHLTKHGNASQRLMAEVLNPATKRTYSVRADRLFEVA